MGVPINKKEMTLREFIEGIALSSAAKDYAGVFAYIKAFPALAATPAREVLVLVYGDQKVQRVERRLRQALGVIDEKEDGDAGDEGAGQSTPAQPEPAPVAEPRVDPPAPVKMVPPAEVKADPPAPAKPATESAPAPTVQASTAAEPAPTATSGGEVQLSDAELNDLLGQMNLRENPDEPDDGDEGKAEEGE